MHTRTRRNPRIRSIGNTSLHREVANRHIGNDVPASKEAGFIIVTSRKSVKREPLADCSASGSVLFALFTDKRRPLDKNGRRD